MIEFDIFDFDEVWAQFNARHTGEKETLAERKAVLVPLDDKFDKLFSILLNGRDETSGKVLSDEEVTPFFNKCLDTEIEIYKKRLEYSLRDEEEIELSTELLDQTIKTKEAGNLGLIDICQHYIDVDSKMKAENPENPYYASQIERWKHYREVIKASSR